MKARIIKNIVVSIIVTIIFSPSLVINMGQTGFKGMCVLASETKNYHKKTRKTPAMRERVYSQLSRAQKLSDEGKIEESLAVLKRMQSRQEQLNSYEKAMMWNFMGFIQYGNKNVKAAIWAFEQVVKQKNIPESVELSTLLSLAQLAMQSEQYNNTLQYLEQWQQVKGGELNASTLVLKSNAYYAMKNYSEALKSISLAVDKAIVKGGIPKESWLILKRALHYELKQSEQVTATSEDLVRYYAKPKYWTELANMYGEVGDTEKQLAVLEAAYQQGYVVKKTDIKSLAQLYYFSGAPYKAAKLMSENLNKGVLPKDVKTLRFLAQSWNTARNKTKAVPVLIEAAKLSKDGNMDARLAETYIALEQWENAIYSAKKALQKGALDNPGNIHIALGMSYYNLKVFDKSIEQFNLAKKIRKQRRVAEQWLKFVKKEQKFSRGLSSVGF